MVEKNGITVNIVLAVLGFYNGDILFSATKNNFTEEDSPLFV